MRVKAIAPRGAGLHERTRRLELVAESPAEEVLLNFLMERIEDGDFRDYRRRLVRRLKEKRR